MKKFFHYLCADEIKIKNAPALWMHLFVPILAITLFLIGYTIHPAKINDAPTVFLGCIIGAFPVLIGIVTGLAAEQESDAGNFQEMLLHPSRRCTLASKLVLLLLLGSLALLLAVFGFSFSFSFFLQHTFFSPIFYLKVSLLALLCNLTTYFFHWFLSLRFGKNISIGIGIVETVAGALLVTNLGHFTWPFIPCAWGYRLLKAFLNSEGTLASFSGRTLILYSMPVITLFSLLALFFWFSCWEGKKSEE